VEAALECGYRHIDTAAAYENHAAVGEALGAGIVPRSDVFLTTKVGPERLRHDDLLAAAEEALRELATDYVDLFLIHWPNADVPMEATFAAMERLLDDGTIRNCGVSNFTARRLAQAVALGVAPISVNQVEYHPHLNQRRLHEACHGLGVALTSYSPFAKGRIPLDGRLTEIGARYGRSAHQVALRWLVQRGIPAIPKAASAEHIRENLGVTEWALSEEDFAVVDNLGHWDRLLPWEGSGPNDQADNG
jgi:diketogulonate reductase-like aldo/keto reductase